MKILAFETSAKAASVALMEDGVLRGECYQNDGQTHSVTLLMMAEQLLQNCGLTPQEIDAVACAAGPGSFTGVRIGVAAAKGFAWGAQKRLIGVSTLEAMARGAATADGIYVACMDARRAQVYNALFEQKGGVLTRLCEDRAISLEELGAQLQNVEKPKIIVGDGALLCYNILKETVPSMYLLPEHLRQQRASGVALAAFMAKEEVPAAQLAPSYLRLSQAERERMARQHTREEK